MFYKFTKVVIKINFSDIIILKYYSKFLFSILVTTIFFIRIILFIMSKSFTHSCNVAFYISLDLLIIIQYNVYMKSNLHKIKKEHSITRMPTQKNGLAFILADKCYFLHHLFQYIKKAPFTQMRENGAFFFFFFSVKMGM